MDHYDVLGVRRSATAEEISLAYRGRRAQYHPDKYSNSTADALQWATGKMQEVNVAYAVLSDPAKRARFDAEFKGRSRASDEQNPEHEGHEEQGDSEGDEERDVGDAPSLHEVLARRLGGIPGHSRICLAPNIPMKKLSSALESYGFGADAEDVLVLIDSTVFGGAREGAMLTQEALLVKDIMSDPVRVEWTNVRRIDASGSSVYVNARKIVDCPVLEEKELARLFAAVQVFVSAGESPRTRTNGRSHGSGRTTSQRQRNREIFETVKHNLLEVCEWLEQFEDDEAQFVDRDAAAEGFEALETNLNHPRATDAVLEELGLINQLCVQVLEVAEDGDAEIYEDLLEDLEDDSQLVEELRTVLQTWTENREEAYRKERTSKFFKR